jgi:hypothetical protein
MDSTTSITSSSSTSSKTTMVELLGINEIIRSPKFQIRAKRENPRAVMSYATMLQAGKTLDPVQVAKVKGAYYLYNGFNRLAAMESLRLTEVLAEVIEGDFSDAELIWMAARANEKNGEALKKADMRNVLRAYIGVGQHHITNSEGKRIKYKTYRAIGADLGIPHTTVRYWIERDFKRLFRAMGSGEMENTGNMGGLRKITAPASLLITTTRDALQTVKTSFYSVNSPEERGEIIEDLEETAGELRKDPRGFVVEEREF